MITLIKSLFCGVLFFFASSLLNAQNHASVPLDSSVYYILEQAQLRGLIDTLPAVKPYSQSLIVEFIEIILEAPGDRLSSTERAILERELERYGPQRETGRMDWTRGSYSLSTEFPGTDTRFSGDIGFGLQSSFSGAHYSGGDIGSVWGMEQLLHAYAKGDIGESFSYNFNFYGTIVRAPREYLGTYHNYYDDFVPDSFWPDAIERNIHVYSQPLTHFPYTFRKNWEGGYFLALNNLSETGFMEWPDTIGVGPHFIAELSGSALGGTLSWRAGRVKREWAAMSQGQSLALNSAAQPFLALEASFRPVSWFGFSAMTGVLEYLPLGGDQFNAAWGSQALFSIEQIELNYKNNIHFAMGTTAVWGKRMELGYIFPLIPNFFYQATVGNFDNTGLFINLGGQLPGTGRLWFSLYIEDLVPATLFEGTFWELNWNQYAYQVGIQAPLPWFGAFTSVTASYTKNEPYNYTHRRMFAPWHNQNSGKGDPIPLSVAYVNNGVSLGHYIPPNSDEFLLRFETMMTANSRQHFQFQLIRNGAAHGPNAVDGSHIWSELDPAARMENPVLRKFFLRDGAYQWQYIFRIGSDYLFTGFAIPVRLFGEFGVVHSYFTNIEGKANDGYRSSYRIINTEDYPRTTGIIASIGFRLFF